jgi:hypothetical protein
MAAPQVAGACALIADAIPSYGPEQMKQYIKFKSTDKMYFSGEDEDEDFDNAFSILGGIRRVLYYPGGQYKPYSVQGSATLTNVGNL